MNYLYHEVPKNMKGNFIYPLNKLKKIYPEKYDFEINKYYGREYQLEDEIPYLNCKWNEVVNLIAIDPRVIFNNLKKCGGNPPKGKWYKIPLLDFDKNNMVVFLYREDLSGTRDYNKKSNYLKFDENNFEKYMIFPKSTFDYYKKCYLKEGRVPFSFHLIPHILYKGSIDVSKCEVIEV